MTMNDNSHLELLERDLERLARPRAGDERVRLALRGQLSARVAPRPRRRLPRLALGMAATAATAAALALAVTSGSGGPGMADAAVVHHALTAVTPPADEILHVKLVGVRNGVSTADETWQANTAPYASFVMNGKVGAQTEFAASGTTGFHYDPATNTISEQPDSSRPGFRDPVSLIRQELAHGQARVAGTVLIDGVYLRKIDLPRGLVVYFDNNSYRPRYLDVPQSELGEMTVDGVGSIVRLQVAIYQYLPMTPSNRALLSMKARHPTARTVVRSSNHSGK
ncbi:MAG: hypothetical protein JO168_22605 [Solirubrobacterales bacterium]|nr:hypothetical protein [Solirubrobacterales bacterium]